MTGRRRKGLAVGIVLLALAGGTGAALAAGGLGFGDDNKALLNDVAKRLDVTPEKLQEALLAAYSDRLDAAVVAGRITKEQADELKQRAKANGGLPFFGGGRGDFGHDHGLVRGVSLDVAATYLGVGQVELRKQLESGKTLAAIATANGKTVAGLKQALADAAKSSLDAAVTAGKLTQAQADDLLTRLEARLDDLIAGKIGPGFGRPHFGRLPAAGMPDPGAARAPASFVAPI
jgi:hypothetical protein